MKAKIYLKTTLLEDILDLVKNNGRYDGYYFGSDYDLSEILNGKFGTELCNNQKKLTLCFDSFMTIWLLTLPEKFKEWFDHYDNNFDEEIQDRAHFNFAERPNFPFFDKNDNTQLCKRENAKSWNFLPKSWILNKCYKFYYGQTTHWMKKFIEYEINY